VRSKNNITRYYILSVLILAVAYLILPLGGYIYAVAASVTTLDATEVGKTDNITSAVLWGTLDNLNGEPNADIWFEWGYSATSLTNTTTVTTLDAVGTYRDTITGYDAGRTVYFRLASETNVFAYGAVESFTLTTGVVVTDFIFETVIPMVIAVLAVATPMYIGFKNHTISLEKLFIYVISGVVTYYLVSFIISAFYSSVL